ncbi:MAG: trypsin-like peptidase domain-containing protein [Myxococcales bacterium]|nr:trypsin-like peptidase domain-containing protein [Myxococcales bacterium]
MVNRLGIMGLVAALSFVACIWGCDDRRERPRLPRAPVPAPSADNPNPTPRTDKPPVTPKPPEHYLYPTSTLKPFHVVRKRRKKPAKRIYFPSFARLFREHSPSVVNISTSQKALSMLPRKTPQLEDPPSGLRHSLGSGFVIDRQGYILTSFHIVKGAESIQVTLYDGTRVEARLIGGDKASNLALLQIPPAANLKPVRWGNSAELQVGEWVFAIGNPFGLSHTITKGIVSAKHRSNISLGTKSSYADYIQTDASLNPGNAGGPLFNVRGEVIGVNIADKEEGKGISFAMPSNLARLVVQQLKKSGKVARSWVGITIEETKEGVLVKRVLPKSPAEAAGLKPGDRIEGWNGHTSITAQTLRWLAGNTGVGKTVKMRIRRAGKLFVAKLTLTSPPSDERE